MKTCSSCKHWSHEGQDTREPRGVFAHAKLGPEWGECLKGRSRGTTEGVAAPLRITTTAFAVDAGDYRAWQATHESHGCTMWEAREAGASDDPWE